MKLPGDLIDHARAVPIGDVVDGVKLGRVGRELVGPCPVCGGRDRFSVHLGKQVFHCRGCSAGGDVVALTMHLHSVDFRRAVQMLAGASPTQAYPPRPARGATSARTQNDAGMLARADEIWRATIPVTGTHGAAYLADRGIALDDVPDHGGLRFHPACPYGPGRVIPCIIARYTDIGTGAPRGIHRRAIAAGITPKTMTLGPAGGCVVRLWPDEDVTHGLVIGEGIETVLAAATRIEHRGTLLAPAWACGTAGNLDSFPALPGVEALTVLADADISGRGQEAAERCAQRWVAAGREVTVLTPRDLGIDFNDLVMHEPP
jgi:phage/plasmid primase-like uncharacterized protein